MHDFLCVSFSAAFSLVGNIEMEQKRLAQPTTKVQARAAWRYTRCYMP
jgi:hypothetical protein